MLNEIDVREMKTSTQTINSAPPSTSHYYLPSQGQQLSSTSIKQEAEAHLVDENTAAGYYCASSASQQQAEEILNEIEFDENDWTIVPTQRGAEKLVSNGYSYVVDKRQQSSINWKCVLIGCKGRAISRIDGPPVKLTKTHSHNPNPKLKEELLKKIGTRSSQTCLTHSQDSAIECQQVQPLRENYELTASTIGSQHIHSYQGEDHLNQVNVVSKFDDAGESMNGFDSHDQISGDSDRIDTELSENSHGGLGPIECEHSNDGVGKVDVEEDEQKWYLTTSNKHSMGGFKLYSDGYCYTVDKPNIKNILEGNFKCIYWKCEIVGCRGRAISGGLFPPLQQSVEHNLHSSNPSKLEQLKARDDLRKLTASAAELTELVSSASTTVHAAATSHDDDPTLHTVVIAAPSTGSIKRFVLRSRNPKRFRMLADDNQQQPREATHAQLPAPPSSSAGSESTHNLINELIADDNGGHDLKIDAAQWSDHDVDEWFTANGIDKRIVDELAPCNGVVLKELYEMRRDAPESFFQTFNSDKRVKFLPSLLKFTHCLKSLFNY